MFPAHALLVVEERPPEQQAEGLQMPEIPLEELALRIIVAAETVARMQRDSGGSSLTLRPT